MRASLGFGLVLASTAALTPIDTTAQAAAQATAQTHIGHVMTGFPGAPNGAALLAVAEGDAGVAAEHARLAGADETNIAPMQTHARHVLRALDGAAIASGPGSGLGVGPAADLIAQHIELAAADPGASDAVKQHSVHVATAARAVSARAAAMKDIANRIVATSDYLRAYNLVRQLQGLAAQLVSGADASGDGTISLAEGGLSHVRTHMGLMGG